MITNFEVTKMMDNRYKIRATKEHREDQIMYLVTFKPAESSLNMGLTSRYTVQSILNYDTNRIDFPYLGSTQPFNINRGLYDVYIAKLIAVRNGVPEIEEGSEEKYPTQIMVGDKYQIKYRAASAISFGSVAGLRVKLISKEQPLDGSTIYYKIDREGLHDVKYYIPFNNQQQVEFFVQGIKENEFSVGTDNDSFEILRA